MSNIVFAAIMPHGDYIPDLGGPNAKLMAKTHRAAMKVEAAFKRARPDVVVIATPHGIIVDGRIVIGVTESAAGTLQGSGVQIAMKLPVDQEFAESLFNEASVSGIPAARFLGIAQQEYVHELDWGAMMPLWYCGAHIRTKLKFVIVSPSNSIHPNKLIEFGKSIERIASSTGKRVAFVASCDWAHAHSESGRYGFHPDAAVYDSEVQKIVRSNQLERLARIDKSVEENALSDGAPQALILHGAIMGSNMHVTLHSYEHPTYFGMLVASYSK